MDSRREFIRKAIGGAFAFGLPGLALGQNTPFRSVGIRLARDMAVISEGGSNVLAAADSDGIVLVDGVPAGHSQVLIEALQHHFGPRPVRSLFNTHWHPEHTGSNLDLARAGATIVSQVNTRLWLGTDIQRPWEDTIHQPLPAEALPSLTFHDKGREVELGGKPVEYGYMLQAHTDGDCYVFFPEANVLACGGLISADRWAMIDWWTGGWFGGLVEGIETLLQVADSETVIVPSQGPLLDRAGLQAQRDMYAELFVRFRDELLFKGLSPAEAVAANPTAGLREDWPDRDAFVTLAFQSLWGFYAPDV